ncbi:2-oxo acid dehydrogenase subunit E2 [Micromonospora sp. RP3T]|uniref:2-oxo acid dehydrogenase subunit E2 n=1 Tax=Micromonospora sp. RP3T TaxID=2135446 RepID=UPI000D16CD1A|nr:2-oxo acid dehydrogenase subunit E2 [Micromonospora sp. RP3T]PTA47665.1 acyltransferase [Micromonospora sp. RP3T]
MTRTTPVPRERRHTLHFLRYARVHAPVFLDTEVDMSAVRRDRERARPDERPPSWVTYVLHAAGRVLAEHPEANAALCGRLRPRLVRYDTVNAKLAFDKSLNGVRVVLTGLIPDVHTATLRDIQEWINRVRDGDPAQVTEFGGARLMHRLPPALGNLLFRAVAHSPRQRLGVLGTLAVTSLGHQPVDAFHSNGGTTITLGVGRVTDRPVVRAGQIVAAPVMRLSMAFDHRVIDGAAAADILGDLVDALENFDGDEQPSTPDPAGAARGAV